MQKSTQRVLITSSALLLSSGMVAAGAFIAAINSASISSAESQAGAEPTLILKGRANPAEPLATMVSPTPAANPNQPELTQDFQGSLVGRPCLVQNIGSGSYAWVKSTQNTDLHDIYFVACLVPKK